MSQYYGNISHSMNLRRISGMSINKQPVDISTYLSDRQIERKEKIEDNNKINTLLKSVHEHPNFIKKRIYFQENIKLLFNADSGLKKHMINKLIECENNEFKILKILNAMEREL